MTPDDLVERVAREICCPPHLGHCCPEECSVHHFLPTARAAIALALEEAADAVGAIGDHADAGAYINAIRALIPQAAK